MDWAEAELETINIGDKRLNKRAKQFLSRVGDKPTISLPGACNGWSETKSAYRLCHGVLNWCTVVREPGSLGAEKDDKRPIEEKESFRWLERYRAVGALSGEQPDTVFVYEADREADIYEIYAERHLRNANGQASAEILVGSQHDRLLADGKKLLDTVGQAAVLGEIAFDMPSTNKREGRSILQTIQAIRIVLKGPNRLKERLPDVELTAIRAREKNPPKDEQPLEWVLLTSRAATTFDQAVEILQWYLCRWQVEIYFKILKSGCKVEELQLQRLTRLEPALAFYMMVAWRVFYLTMLGRACPEIPCRNGVRHAFMYYKPAIPELLE